MQTDSLTPTAIALIDSALQEVERRQPGYFRRFPVHWPSVSRRLAVHEECGMLDGMESGALTAFLERCAQHLARNGVVLSALGEAGDRVGDFLFDSALDAFAAGSDRLSLRAAPLPRRTVEQALESDFTQGRSRYGTRYFIRKQGTHPLVVLNAVGLPLGVWTRLLDDGDHPFRTILVESRSSDLLTGGMRGDVSRCDDARDVFEILERESLEAVSVLAWCNGGRVALELAAEHPERIRSLVLVSTTLLGFSGVELPASAFEENLRVLFQTVNQRPTLARYFLDRLLQGSAPELEQDDPELRATLLFRQPAKEHVRLLQAPLTDMSSLLKYGARCEQDVTCAIDATLGRVRQPVLLITGSEDEIVNNELTLAALGAAKLPFTHLELSAAGHYIADLQYPYLIWAMKQWLGQGRALHATARLRLADPQRLRLKVKASADAS